MDDGVDDAVAAGQVGKARHGASAAADLAKGAFNGVGRTDAATVGGGHRVEGE